MIGVRLRRIGEAIRRDRQAQGLTLLELSKRVGLSPTYLSLVERGLARPNERRIAEIGEALGWSKKEIKDA